MAQKTNPFSFASEERATNSEANLIKLVLLPCQMRMRLVLGVIVLCVLYAHSGLSEDESKFQPFDGSQHSPMEHVGRKKTLKKPKKQAEVKLSEVECEEQKSKLAKVTEEEREVWLNKSRDWRKR